MRKYKFLIWLFPILVCMMIFSFSADSGEESTEISFPITIDIMEGWDHVFHLNWDDERVLEMAQNAEIFVRKAGHMSEYAFLAISVLTAVVVSMTLSKTKVVYSGLFCVLYAASDEIHQLFVPGRSGKFTDVCIDSVGVMLGMVLFLWIRGIVTRNIMKNAIRNEGE